MRLWIDFDFHLWPLRYFSKQRREFLEKHSQAIEQRPFLSQFWYRYGHWLYQIARHEAKIARINFRLATGQYFISLCKAIDKLFGTNILRRRDRALRKRRRRSKTATS